jgi:hypothetical protein
MTSRIELTGWSGDLDLGVGQLVQTLLNDHPDQTIGNKLEIRPRKNPFDFVLLGNNI